MIRNSKIHFLSNSRTAMQRFAPRPSRCAARPRDAARTCPEAVIGRESLRLGICRAPRSPRDPGTPAFPRLPSRIHSPQARARPDRRAGQHLGPAFPVSPLGSTDGGDQGPRRLRPQRIPGRVFLCSHSCSPGASGGRARSNTPTQTHTRRGMFEGMETVPIISGAEPILSLAGMA